MVTYLSNKPLLSVLFSMIGLALLIAAIVLNPFKAIRAGATGVNSNCTDAHGTETFSYPGDPVSIPTKTSYNSTWDVTEWLRYDSNANDSRTDDNAFPIGPSGWLVCGKSKDANGTMTTYQESWKLQQVRLASSRRATTAKGQPYNRTTGASDGFSGDKLEVKESSIQANGDDSAFKNDQDLNWNPVGLYGALFTSADGMELSWSFYPSKWSVSGSF